MVLTKNGTTSPSLYSRFSSPNAIEERRKRMARGQRIFVQRRLGPMSNLDDVRTPSLFFPLMHCEFRHSRKFQLATPQISKFDSWLDLIANGLTRLSERH